MYGMPQNNAEAPVTPREYEYINEFLGPIGGIRTDTIEAELAELTEFELGLINNCLSAIDFDNDPTRDWRRELYNGNPQRFFSELILVTHLRDQFGRENVAMNATIQGPGSKDFDIRILNDEHDVWVEIVTPDFAGQFETDDGEYQGGFIGGTRTSNAIDRKLRGEFKLAREHLPSDSVLVLAVYYEAGILQNLTAGKWLDEDHYDVAEYCDAWIEYTHPSPSKQLTTQIVYSPFSETGGNVGPLMDRWGTENDSSQ